MYLEPMTTISSAAIPAHGPALPKAYWEKSLLVLAVVAFATFDPRLLALYLAFAGVMVLYRLPELARIPMADAALCVAIAAIMTVSMAASAYSSPTAIYHYVVAVLSLVVAIMLTREPAKYVSASRFALVAAQTAVLLFLAYAGLDDFPLERMIPNASSNGITSYLIVLQFNYSVGRYLLTRKSSLITAGITLAICVVGYGRGSILSASGLFAIVALYAALSYRLPSRAKWILAGTGALAAVVLLPFVMEFIVQNTKVAAGLVDQPRMAMIASYLSRIDGWTLFVGASYEGTVIDSLYNGNPHNAFIRAHHLLGLPYLVAMVLLPAHIWFNQKGIATKFYLLAMFGVIFFRAFTEPVLFPTPFDLFYFAICIGMARTSPPAANSRG